MQFTVCGTQIGLIGENMSLKALRGSIWLPLVLLAACSDPVLEGPNHGVEGPPWIASNMTTVVPEIELQRRVILIGDAGLYLAGDPTLAALGKWAEEVEDSAVLFLGDNIYDDGLIDEARVEAEQILSQQLAATDRLKIFIPGNHDWGLDPAEQNLTAIMNQQTFIDNWHDGQASFLPRDGCIGPAIVELGGGSAKVVLLLLDPTPFLTPRLRDQCENNVDDATHFSMLESLLEQYADDHVIVASHYPLLTGGPHGGLPYPFPINLIAGAYGLMLGGLGNTYEPPYAAWIEKVEAVMRKHPPLVYAAGHDHSLQVLKGGDVASVQVVSGAGALERVSTVTHIPETLYAHAAAGFVVLDFGSYEGETVAVLRVVENIQAAPMFEMLLER
jgi:hypothetical protein